MLPMVGKCNVAVPNFFSILDKVTKEKWLQVADAEFIAVEINGNVVATTS